MNGTTPSIGKSMFTAIFGSTGVVNIHPDSVILTTVFQITLCNQDVADEDAAKIGALYKFKETGTTIGAIVEHMTRYVPGDLAFQNERTRWGTWSFLSQQMTPKDSVHVGWAHAFRTPGDPGQHNDFTLTTSDGTGTLRHRTITRPTWSRLPTSTCSART